IVPRTSAPERTNFHAASISLRESPTKWKTSVSTASEVSSGSRSCRNASTQASCQRSLRSSSARIAPVSISALAAIMPLQALAKRIARRLGPARVAAGEDSEAVGRGAVQSALRLVFRNVRIALLQPIAHGSLQHRRNRHLAQTRFPLQVRLKFARQTPAVNFASHALQCSALQAALQHNARKLRQAVHPTGRPRRRKRDLPESARRKFLTTGGTEEHRGKPVIKTSANSAFSAVQRFWALLNLNHALRATGFDLIHARRHIAGESEQRLRMRRVLSLEHGRSAAVARFANLRIELDASEEGDAELLRRLFRAAAREDVDFVLAVRADEVAHVFYHADDIHFHLAEHLNGLARIL